jgi:hypothetical protein
MTGVAHRHKTMISNLLLTGAALLAAMAIPARAQLVNENFLVPLPPGYKIDFRDKKKNMLMTEMVPVGETVSNWTEMVTVQIFYDFAATPDQFRERLQVLWAGSCPGAKFSTLSSEAQNGYPAILWVQKCFLNGATGKPEHTWFKAIKGKDASYLIQKAFKFEPSEAQIALWVGYLKGTSVCDSRVPERACPPVKQNP